MDTNDHLTLVATKLDALSERLHSRSLAVQETLAELRNELTSLGHCFSENHQDLTRLTHAVFGNGKEGVCDRLLKLEQANLRQAEQRTRQLGAVWTVLVAVVVYLLTTLLGKVL